MEGAFKCGICLKSFPSRQGLGGHMRSHFVFLPISPKPETSGDSKAQSKSTQPSTSGLADKRGKKRGMPIDNPNNSSQPVIDQICILSSSDSDSLPDRTVAKISSGKPSCHKAKAIRRSRFTRVPMSSKASTDMLSVTSSIDDVAQALVDLSEGKMTDTRRKINKGKRKLDNHRGGNDDGEERNGYDGDAEESSNKDDKDDESQLQEQMPKQIHQCPACKKQDATNRKKMVMEDKGGNAMTIYECLSCSRLFESCMSLDGNVKVVNSRPSNSPSEIPSSSIPEEAIECKKQLLEFDLNLPPPDEDDEIN